MTNFFLPLEFDCGHQNTIPICLPGCLDCGGIQRLLLPCGYDIAKDAICSPTKVSDVTLSVRMSEECQFGAHLVGTEEKEVMGVHLRIQHCTHWYLQHSCGHTHDIGITHFLGRKRCLSKHKTRVLEDESHNTTEESMASDVDQIGVYFKDGDCEDCILEDVKYLFEEGSPALLEQDHPAAVVVDGTKTLKKQVMTREWWKQLLIFWKSSPFLSNVPFLHQSAHRPGKMSQQEGESARKPGATNHALKRDVRQTRRSLRFFLTKGGMFHLLRLCLTFLSAIKLFNFLLSRGYPPREVALFFSLLVIYIALESLVIFRLFIRSRSSQAMKVKRGRSRRRNCD